MADIEVSGRHRKTGPDSPGREWTGFRLSWGAIFAGLVVAMVVQVFLGLLGIGIGLAWWDPGDSAQALGIGAGIWAAVTMIAALFAGGATTGRLAGLLTPEDGALHGVLVWGLSLIATLFLVTTGVGTVVGGAFQVAQSPVAATVIDQQDQAEVERRAEEAAEAFGETLEDARQRIMTGEATDQAAVAAWWALLAMALGLGAAVGGAVLTARD
jgi:hypothetical protein